MPFLRSLTGQRLAAHATAGAGMEHSEEMLAEVDEPPDEAQSQHATRWSSSELHPASRYTKGAPSPFARRESLLTRQLHSETDHTDDEPSMHAPPRAWSTQSMRSNQSTTSTAELTSDDGRSAPSPCISPPLPPTHIRTALPTLDNPLLGENKVKIVGLDDTTSAQRDQSTGPEKIVEAGLGRKRCISFACGRKAAEAKKPASPTPEPPKAVMSSPPKRKCTLKFVCPTRAAPDRKPSETVPVKRASTPPPHQRKPSGSAKPESIGKPHRGSVSTVVHSSPKNGRKSSTIIATAPISIATTPPKLSVTPTLSHNSDESGAEALRFHEFGTSEDEPEEWVRESTCHRKRLTVSDTLEKENVLRKACKEVEEEVIEEEEGEEEEEDAAEEVDDDNAVEDDDDDAEKSEQSDAGFHSDDEEGFAESDDEGESDFEWWKPGGSTAATSVDHLDRLAVVKAAKVVPATSVDSISSANGSPRPRHRFYKGPRTNTRTHRVTINKPIENKPTEADLLPDSTDFVCGTLDEDRPLEQAFINRKKALEAAKHKARPQDIDPSFPASDPEMDEEDDEDLEDPEDSAPEDLMHGELEELDGTAYPPKRRPSPAPRGRPTHHRSPPPPARPTSPQPKKRTHYHSPPPPTKRGTARSPPPSETPRNLFGRSPRHARSPAPFDRTTSPPNTARASPTHGASRTAAAYGLGSRPQLTHTASLPRGNGFPLSHLAAHTDEDGEDTAHDERRSPRGAQIPKRGAIDIFKGLEKKRQRRKEKLYQKLCAKAAAKGEKAYKVKPGRGAERMREVGLELQRYRGAAGGKHILSL